MLPTPQRPDRDNRPRLATREEVAMQPKSNQPRNPGRSRKPPTGRRRRSFSRVPRKSPPRFELARVAQIIVVVLLVTAAILRPVIDLASRLFALLGLLHHG